MRQAHNIYCDESCHLLRDQQKIMALGAIWCPTEAAHQLSLQVRSLKLRHGLSPRFELKWTKVSPAKRDFYADLVDLFFDETSLHFRGLLVSDKSKLDHVAYGQTHDEWYYKMFFRLLQPIIRPDYHYRIYLDIKDTRSADRIRKLSEVLANANYDFDRTSIERVQTVRSHEVELLQLSDLLTGAIAYRNRNLSENAGKTFVVERIVRRSGKSLVRSTFLGEQKFNLFVWTPAQPSPDMP